MDELLQHLIKTSQPMAQETGYAEFGTHVLLVDDHNPNIIVTSTYLESFGYKFDVCENGLDALTEAKSNKYFAVLMDVRMPTMDGVEATTHIRNYERDTGRGHLPIIAMTAHYMASDRETCLRAGMDYYLTKPFNPEDLKVILDKLWTQRVLTDD